MKTYLLTGGATGIGAAIRAQLINAGHKVVTVDLKDGDYLADLGDATARANVIDRIRSDHPVLEGIITCAGVASQFPDPAKILSINYFGTTELISGLIDSVSAGGRVVAISSNSAPMCAKPELIDTLLSGDEAAAVALGSGTNGHECYAGSKQAVARWMRRQAPDYARHGVSFNAIAPGYVQTPMTQAVEESEEYGELIKAFLDSIPIGRPGQADDVANLVMFLLSPGGAYIAGSTLFIDGAHDAMMRPDAPL